MRTGYFTGEFLRSLPLGGPAALTRVFSEFWHLDTELQRETSRGLAFEIYMEAYRMCRSVLTARGLQMLGSEEIDQRTERTIEAIRRAVFATGEANARLRIDGAKEAAQRCNYKGTECEEIGQMLKAIKEKIKETSTIADGCKMRLMNRVEDTIIDLTENCCAKEGR
jgi:hypothetical protein